MGFFGTKSVFRRYYKVEPPAIDPASVGGNGGQTADIQAALDGSNGASGSNVFATMNDVGPKVHFLGLHINGADGFVLDWTWTKFLQGVGIPDVDKVDVGHFTITEASSGDNPFVGGYPSIVIYSNDGTAPDVNIRVLRTDGEVHVWFVRAGVPEDVPSFYLGMTMHQVMI